MFCCVYVWFAFGGLRVYLIASGYGFIVLGWLGLVYVFWVCVMFIGCFRVVVLLVVLFVLVVLFDFLCDWYVILFEFVVVCWYYWVGCGCWLTCFVFVRFLLFDCLLVGLFYCCFIVVVCVTGFILVLGFRYGFVVNWFVVLFLLGSWDCGLFNSGCIVYV